MRMLGRCGYSRSGGAHTDVNLEYALWDGSRLDTFVFFMEMDYETFAWVYYSPRMSFLCFHMQGGWVLERLWQFFLRFVRGCEEGLWSTVSSSLTQKRFGWKRQFCCKSSVEAWESCCLLSVADPTSPSFVAYKLNYATTSWGLVRPSYCWKIERYWLPFPITEAEVFRRRMPKFIRLVWSLICFSTPI